MFGGKFSSASQNGWAYRIRRSELKLRQLFITCELFDVRCGLQVNPGKVAVPTCRIVYGKASRVEAQK